jgi:hypothetical protein
MSFGDSPLGGLGGQVYSPQNWSGCLFAVVGFIMLVIVLTLAGKFLF